MKKIIEFIKRLFTAHCPECGGDMKSELWDIKYDRPIYKCKKCGKEWI